MADSIYIRSLASSDLTEMYLTFLDAFSDYPIDFKLSKEQFVKRFVDKLKIDFDLSVGAFDFDGAMMGFIFTSVNNYENKLTAYNGGTGVRQRHRGKKLTLKMYEASMKDFSRRGIEQCVLEVLQNNERAVAAYKSAGFEITRSFNCYVLNSTLKEYELPNNVQIIKVAEPNWESYATLINYSPSFLDAHEMIMKNQKNEIFIELKVDNELKAYAIFQPNFRRFSQIGIAHEQDGFKYCEWLVSDIQKLSENKTLTIINIEDNATYIHDYLTAIGFDNQINQFEMVKAL